MLESPSPAQPPHYWRQPCWPPPRRPPPPASDIVELPITFQVENTNRTMVACESDGEEMTVRGTLIAPAAALEDADAATLYLHAVTWERDYWMLDIDGFNYARDMAERGHVSVAVDRIDYGASTRPDGFATCFGSEADVAGQMVDALRSGEYELDGAEATSFEQVFAASARCFAPPGINKDRENYTPFAKGSRATFYFNSSPAEVRDQVPGLRADPCGQLISLVPALSAHIALVPQIDVPVLVMFGDADAIFPPPAADQQAARYVISPEVTKSIIPGASHYPLVEENRDQVVEAAEWLTKHGG